MIAAKHWRTHVGHWRLPRRPPRLSVQHTGVSPPEEIQVEKRRTMKFIEFRLSTFSPPQVFHFQCFRQNRREGVTCLTGKISVSGVTSISRDFRLVWHAALKEWLKIDGGSTSWRSFGEREEEERLIPGLLFFPPFAHLSFYQFRSLPVQRAAHFDCLLASFPTHHPPSPSEVFSCPANSG